MRAAPGKPPSLAPALADGEGKPGLHRRGGFVHVLAVKRKASLKTQRIARAKADGQHFRLRKQLAGEGLGELCGDRDFEAILAGVTRARDKKRLGIHMKHTAFHETQRFDAGNDARKNRYGFRSLQGEQRALRLGHKRDARRKPRADMREVDLLARGVHDQRQAFAIGGARHHQVVDDAAPGVRKLRVADAPRFQAEDIGGGMRFDRLGCRLEIRRFQPRLAHMRDVEQSGGGAHMVVLFDDTRRVLQRHLVAREGHELGAKLAVQRV